MTTDGRDPAARAAVPRARDPEPDRVRGHVSRCPRRSSTASCCASAFGYPDARAPSGRCWRAGIERREDDVELEPVIDRADTARDAGGRRARARRSLGRPLHRRPRRGDAREHAASPVGASPRGSLALLKLSRCRAALAGRDFVTPDDVKAVAVPALAHRLAPEARALGAAALAARTSSARRSRRCRRHRPRTSARRRRDTVRLAPARRLRRPRGARR